MKNKQDYSTIASAETQSLLNRNEQCLSSWNSLATADTKINFVFLLCIPQVTSETYVVLYKKEWLQSFDCHGYCVFSTTFSWEMEEEVPGCICQTSIYIYSTQHNIICNNKEEKIEVKILCKMSEWKRSLKLYIL